jgi:hypothetical protein
LVSSKPLFRQTFTGNVDTVPGASKVPPPAQYFQSLAGTTPPFALSSVTTPFTVSLLWTRSTSPACVRSAGKYGIGLPITLSGADTCPLRLTIRPMRRPVTLVSTGTFT